jgi:hypothetical protein
MLDISHIAIEVTSSIACLVLIRFMMIPYQLTREGRYVGLPLGFGFLGLSYVLTIVLLIPPFGSNTTLAWVAHLARVFAFVFLAITYYFSKKPSKNSRLLWDLTLSLVIILLVTSSLLLFFTPQDVLAYNGATILFMRIVGLICLCYVISHTLRSHLTNPEITKIWIPLGFILLTISQGSLLLTYFASSYGSIWGWGGLAVRLASLAVFLGVSIHTVFIEGKKRRI